MKMKEFYSLANGAPFIFYPIKEVGGIEKSILINQGAEYRDAGCSGIDVFGYLIDFDRPQTMVFPVIRPIESLSDLRNIMSLSEFIHFFDNFPKMIMTLDKMFKFIRRLQPSSCISYEPFTIEV